MAPSAAPAPAIMCISSMNSTVERSRYSSSNRFLNRSSKSPRYFVPATMDAMSNANNRLPRSAGVICPLAMRWASASARALLPTPGSPSRQGLFFWRRQRISIIRSSSASRQSTGSSRPSCARRVRSRPYFSLGRPVRLDDIRGCAGSTNCPESWRHSRAAWGSSIPKDAIHRLAVQDESSSIAQSRCSFSALAALAAWAPNTANSMALVNSGARSRECSCRGLPRLRAALHPASAVDVTRLRRRKSAAVPRAVCTSASSRWPVSAWEHPCCPASTTAVCTVRAAVREKPLYR